MELRARCESECQASAQAGTMNAPPSISSIAGVLVISQSPVTEGGLPRSPADNHGQLSSNQVGKVHDVSAPRQDSASSDPHGRRTQAKD